MLGKKIHIIFLLFSFKIAAQVNLVPNPSFEDTLHCPSAQGQIYNSIGWINPSTSANSNPDYFNSCTNSITGLSVPTNAAGFQYAHTGNAYAGFYAFNTGSPNAYEYVETMLSDTLKKDTAYCVSFYLSLAEMSAYCTNNIGVYFSNTLVTTPTEIILATPQLVNTTIVLSDKVGWMKVEWHYIASGGEKYFTIGNFNSTFTSDTLYVGGTWDFASYYYLDDVFIGKCDTAPPAKTSSLTIPNAFSPNNDGHNDVFTLQGWKNYVTEFTIIIYDRWGEKVFENNDPEKGWDGSYKGTLMEPGVFVYYINATAISGEKIVKKGNISLIR